MYTRYLVDDPTHAETLTELRTAMQGRMDELHGDYHPPSHYQSWLADDGPDTVVRNAYGPYTRAHPSTVRLRKDS